MTDNLPNFFCKYNEDLYKKYPYKEDENPQEAGDRIMKESFPNIERIK